MKKLLVTAFFLTLAVNAQACNITFTSTSEKVTDVLTKNGFGFDDYGAVCKRLNSNNARLFIEGQAGVLEGRSIAWASVQVGDKNLHIIANGFGASEVRTSPYASIDEANKILLNAINSSINKTEIEKSIGELDKSRKKLKAAYK